MPLEPVHFEPDSAIWKISRERALLWLGLRTLLLQIAHPMVAESVYQHSYVFQHPVKRLFRTLNLTLTLVFGTTEEIKAAFEAIDSAHRPAVGQLTEAVGKHQAGASYNPRNPRQGLWVIATLIEGAITGYENFVAPLSTEEKDEFYQSMMAIAEQLGVHATYAPENYAALLDYMQQALESGEVCVGTSARRVAPFITVQSIPVLNILLYPIFRLSVVMLPPALRTQYGYRLHSWEEKLLNAFCRWHRRVLPYLPSFIRYQPEYRRALARVSEETSAK